MHHPQSHVNAGDPGSHRYTHRIPRGASDRGDPISRLERQAAANHKRIRGMKLRTQPGKYRKALEAARLRLVEVLRTIAECPESVRIGTFELIDSVMAEARGVYADAPKLKLRIPRKKRPAERKGRRAKNAPKTYDPDIN